MSRVCEHAEQRTVISNADIQSVFGYGSFVFLQNEMQNSTRDTEHAPPMWVVVVVLFVGIVFVGGTTWGAYRRAFPAESTDGVQAKNADDARSATPEGAPIANQTALSGWRAMLSGTTCPSPCVGGSGCTEKPKSCHSGLTCIPGTGKELLDGQDSWGIHLSFVDLDGVDPCQSNRDFWVCLGSSTTSCVSQRQACAAAATAGHAVSTESIRVTGDQLASGQVTLAVHENGVESAITAASRPVQKLLRGGLCQGFKVGIEGMESKYIYYFVLPE